jgi:chromosome segregation ATPase
VLHKRLAELETEHAGRRALEERSIQLDAALAAKNGEVAKLQGDLEAAGLLAEQLRASEQERGVLHKRLAELETEHAGRRALEERSIQLDAALAAKNGEVAKLQAELETEQKGRGALEERSTQLEAALAAKSGQVAKLQGEREAARLLAQQLRTSKQERSVLEQRLSQAETEARAALVLRRRQEEANDQSDRARQALDGAIADLAAAHLESDLAKEGLHERDDLRMQLEAVLDSRAWRLTAPLRQIVGKAKTTFKRLS